MRAISGAYSPKNAAVKAIEAGADIVLYPMDFYEAYNGVVEAVKDGTLSESRIKESLRRILKVKKMLRP